MKIVPDNKNARRSGNSAAKKEHCVAVDMNLVYADSSGHSDEDWIALPDNQHLEPDATLRNENTEQ
ncbi:MAG: hypothetical protein LBS77_02385 [Desulfovibrio sp.]|jgi:hypothetical protein|nr:hypothetical protein [Desulfovibrio sp.]